MRRTTWFHNRSPGDVPERVRFFVQVKRRILKKKTPFQTIEVLETPEYGRMLVLDGILQLAEADEFLYHEMLVHTALLSHSQPRKVLVIGGGDGGALRELVKYRSIKKIVLAELDREVIRVAEKFLPGVSQGAFHDPRVTVHIGNGATFLAQMSAPSFDVIINDSTDFMSGSSAEALFSSPFYQRVLRTLKRNGIFATLVGDIWDTPPPRAHKQKTVESVILRRLKGAFPNVRSHWFPVPSFGDIYGVAICNTKKESWETLTKNANRRWAKRRIPVRFFTPEIFLATVFFGNRFPETAAGDLRRPQVPRLPTQRVAFS